jgi:hypothetical protein
LIAMLDSKTLAAITRQVQARFPEAVGCQPKVRQQALPKSPAPTVQAANYLVTYRSQAVLPAGGHIERLIRVTVNVNGKILKISTSR